MRSRARFFPAVTLGLLLLVAVPEIRTALAGLEYFRVREVEVLGMDNLTRDAVLSQAALRPRASVWDDLSTTEARLAAHPLVRTVEVHREFPDGLIIELEERRPVAFLPTPVLTPVDAEARLLPVPEVARRLDLPLLQASVDAPGERVDLTPAQLRRLTSELATLREIDPASFASVSEVSIDAVGDILLHLGEPRVAIHYRAPLAPGHLREANRVLRDALRRTPDRIPGRVDLRFRGQIVVHFMDALANQGGGA